MGDWKPIETAPRSNGSHPFLAYVPGHGHVVAYRSESDGGIFNRSKPARASRIHKATHWMSLPAAPSI